MAEVLNDVDVVVIDIVNLWGSFFEIGYIGCFVASMAFLLAFAAGKVVPAYLVDDALRVWRSVVSFELEKAYELFLLVSGCKRLL